MSVRTHKNDCFYTHTHSTVRAVRHIYTTHYSGNENLSFRDPHPANFLTIASFEIATTRFL